MVVDFVRDVDWTGMWNVHRNVGGKVDRVWTGRWTRILFVYEYLIGAD